MLTPAASAGFDELCRFGEHRPPELAETIAAAFADDPIWKWMLHGTDEPVPADGGFALALWLISALSPVDEIHGFRHHGAVALWHAPRTEAHRAIVEEHAEIVVPFADALGDVFEARLACAADLAEAMAEFRPEEPHWYLGILATDPDRQNQGLGSRVLDMMHRRCDDVGLPCYLESSNPRNHGFYRGHGYVESSEFTAADSPPLLGMWREPR